MSFPAPFDRYQGEVLPEWIDANGHMNLAYYIVLFDYATDTLFNAIGIGLDYKDRTNHCTFVAEPTPQLVPRRLPLTGQSRSYSPCRIDDMSTRGPSGFATFTPDL